MDNSSYRLQYIEDRRQVAGFTDKTLLVLEQTFQRISRFEEAIGKTLEEGMTREELVSLFENLQTVKTSSFIAVKSRIMTYLEWLNARGASIDTSALAALRIQDISVDPILDGEYFRDFQSLQDAVQEVLHAANKVSDDVFATQIAAIYLAWCGVRVEDLVDIEKQDVYEDCILVKGKQIRPNETIMSFLRRYRDLEGYDSLGRTIIFLKYAPSSFLLRTMRVDRINPKSISALFSKLNLVEQEQNSNRRFVYSNIYRSGVFHRAYLYECENGKIQKDDLKTISRVFCEEFSTVSLANIRLQEYNTYRNHFFPN